MRRGQLAKPTCSNKGHLLIAGVFCYAVKHRISEYHKEIYYMKAEHTQIHQEVPQTEQDELERIMEQQRVEVPWWENTPNMETVADIEKAVEGGSAVIVPDEGTGYKVSANVKPEFRVLEKNTKTALDEVAEEWLRGLEERGLSDPKLFLIISSLARTTEFQKELIAKGYPAAEQSTHTHLGAFDIASKWLSENRPEVLDVLTEVLNKIKAENRINFIEEPSIGAYHIAFNRTTIH